MNLVERTAAMIATVDQYRLERSAALLEPARAEARAIVKAALADARRRVRTAIDEERKRLRREVAAVEASLATERRLVAQQRAVRQLGLAWSALRTALAARWNDPATRAAWADQYVARGLECLAPDGDWRIRYSPAWTEDERDCTRVRLQARGIHVIFEEDRSLAAGFVIVCGYNVLDASLDGLLAERSTIEGRLLQRLEEAHT